MTFDSFELASQLPIYLSWINVCLAHCEVRGIIFFRMEIHPDF